ncbi:MAG TPA: MotA/TolQ/ExbB proton channel family protein, partial [Myxococcota bacterium]|nr:MotA/TolQ/ExbB proton channel family protein [Myxococcota bacterium]HOD01013.1 MotA/TolQ/ExbB proton channel family protein [Myxococcota bacterium]HOH76714.1 MotA/TolQ/ExbB proton channel family protein [Myxococcota bacterium]HPV04956.1 MotA/TolQ/ExbB proton channel family protein [Myxococcota bacterium]
MFGVVFWVEVGFFGGFHKMFEAIAVAFEAGGPNMFVILAIGIFMWGIIIERLIVLYFKANVDKDGFMRVLTKYILVGDLRNALKLCSISKFPLAKIIQAGLMKAKESDAAVQAAMDEAALREVPRIEKRIGFLAVIGNVGVLAGLLGTIFGLIASFGAAATADAATKATKLAEGISEAMYNTAFGLGVAILASIFYAFYQAKAQSLVDTINEGTVTTLNLITANRDKFDDKVSE